MLTSNAFAAERGSAIFLHPDGMGANTWGAVRLMNVGPDGRLGWDSLPAMALYVGPMRDNVTATSNGAATVHAWGLRVGQNSFGTDNGAKILKSASGFAGPLALEAKAAGKAVGLVNSASVTDAGTGAQVASVAQRKDHAGIAAQILDAGIDVILGGGEIHFLPTEVTGRHGKVGTRTDGRNLIKEAAAKGYYIAYNAQELAAVPKDASKVLGLFAPDDTFNDQPEEALIAQGLPHYRDGVPRYDVMVAAALRVLERAQKGFYLVAEEEGTDNFAGKNNAAGVFDAATGADRAITIVRNLIAKRPDIGLVIASDSDAGGLQVTGDHVIEGQTLPPIAENGAPLDGQNGKATVPFLAAPDRFGQRLPFAVMWASAGDNAGGGVVRADGSAAPFIKGTIDATTIYHALHQSLFPKKP
jgi:alkaline phosphatase